MTYADEVLADSPLAYWRLGESSGTTAADSSGSALTATYVGSHTLGAAGVMADGSGNASVNASGAAGSGVLGQDWSALEFAGLAPYTIECWFNADTLADGSHILVQKQATAASNGWELVAVGGASPQLVLGRGAGAGDTWSGAGVVAVGSSHHVAVTFDGATTRMYVDGALVVRQGGAVSMAANSERLSIGYDSVGGGFAFDGRIDEVAIYGSALTCQRIRLHFIVGAPTAPTPPPCFGGPAVGYIGPGLMA